MLYDVYNLFKNQLFKIDDSILQKENIFQITELSPIEKFDEYKSETEFIDTETSLVYNFKLNRTDANVWFSIKDKNTEEILTCQQKLIKTLKTNFGHGNKSTNCNRFNQTLNYYFLLDDEKAGVKDDFINNIGEDLRYHFIYCSVETYYAYQIRNLKSA